MGDTGPDDTVDNLAAASELLMRTPNWEKKMGRHEDLALEVKLGQWLDKLEKSSSHKTVKSAKSEASSRRNSSAQNREVRQQMMLKITEVT